LKALKSGVFSSGSTSTPVKQYLKFDQSTMRVDYLENDDNVVADTLFVPDSSVIFEYDMEFTEGAASELTDTGANLDDYEGEVLTILGAPYTVVEVKRPTSTANSIKMTLLGGQVADVLRDGETKTYTIDGKDYEVTAVFISSDNTPKAKLSVNGVMTKERSAGQTEVLGTDVTVGIQSILTNQREGLVEFYLGANKLELTDSNYVGTTYDTTGTVKVNGKSITDGEVIIKATNESSTSVKLNSIKYRLKANNDLFVPAGKGVKEFLDKKEGMLTDTWDVKYAGLLKTGDSEVKFNAQSDYGYKLSFENINGVKYNFPLITNRNAAFKWGDDDDDFIFTESNNGNNSNVGNLTLDINTFISDNDYFAVSDRAAGDDKAATAIYRYQSISVGDSTVTFTDLAGNDVVQAYTGTPGSDATGDLIDPVGGTHHFYVGGNGAGQEKYALAMDLDSSGTVVNGTTVDLVVKGGGLLSSQKPQVFDAAGPTAMTASIGANFTLTTTSSAFDEAADGPTHSNISITGSGAGSAAVIDINSVIHGSQMLNLQDKDEYTRGYTTYGALFELYNPTANNKAGELSINYPLSMRGAQVFVTAGTVEVKEGELGESGKVVSTTLHPIQVGLSVLDTDAPALGTTKMIVIGGPCVNTKAAELMANPTNCAEGFTAGKAVIKLFADKQALLVAGYGAQDTLGACYALADHARYKLSGNEVEVVVADLNQITVNPVKAVATTTTN
jgi:hypothetical protein